MSYFIVKILLTRHFYCAIMLLYIKGRSGRIVPISSLNALCFGQLSGAEFGSEMQASIRFLPLAEG